MKLSYRNLKMIYIKINNAQQNKNKQKIQKKLVLYNYYIILYKKEFRIATKNDILS